MKLELAVLIAVAAVANALPNFAPEAHLETQIVGENFIDKLVKQALEKVRATLKAKQPYSIPNIPQQVIVEDHVNVKVDISDLTIDKADDFVVEHIENNLPNLWAKFAILFPNPHFACNFKIDGNALGKKVSGSGSFTVELQKMNQSGLIQMGHKDKGLFIQEVDLDFNLSDAKFGLTGLNVEGMTDQEVLDFLNHDLMDALQKSHADVCKTFGEAVRDKGNSYIEGKTLSQVIEWLKKIINK